MNAMNKSILLKKRPEGTPKNSDFEFTENENLALTIFAKQDFEGVPIEDRIPSFARIELRKQSTGTKIFETQTTSAAFGAFATDGVIAVRTKFNFKGGNENNGLVSYRYSGSSGAFAVALPSTSPPTGTSNPSFILPSSLNSCQAFGTEL
jgi:hypothetical protein